MTDREGVMTYNGSCYCGAIRYEVDLDPHAGTTRCNCTYCSKIGWWGTQVKPDKFRLLQGSDSLVHFGTSPVSERGHCKVCGILAFNHGSHPAIGGEYYSVNLRCLDADLVGVPVKYVDGRSDTWQLICEAPYVNPFGSAGGVV